MTRGCELLRKELSRLTVPPDGSDVGWLDDQIREIANLNREYPHSVSLHTHAIKVDHEGNCFMQAFGIVADDVRHCCVGDIFPGADFVAWLLVSSFAPRPVGRHEGSGGAVVIYLDDAGRPTHAGIYARAKVVSKWGSGVTHIWEHAMWDVPIEYGDRVKFFRPLPNAKAVSAFEEWAVAR